jgi:hypothetical protein
MFKQSQYFPVTTAKEFKTEVKHNRKINLLPLKPHK